MGTRRIRNLINGTLPIAHLNSSVYYPLTTFTRGVSSITEIKTKAQVYMQMFSRNEGLRKDCEKIE